MAELRIRHMGDPVLRKKALPVEQFDDQLKQLAADMIETMYLNEGVGLAAPQVGVSRRMIVYDNVEESFGLDPQVLVNPEIIEREGVQREEEGCLSIPELKEMVDRAERVVVLGQDLDGRRLRVEAAGMPARILQHEIDHLDGILFVDRVGAVKKNLLMSRWKKIVRDLEAEQTA